MHRHRQSPRTWGKSFGRKTVEGALCALRSDRMRKICVALEERSGLSGRRRCRFQQNRAAVTVVRRNGLVELNGADESLGVASLEDATDVLGGQCVALDFDL